ncbi:MAG: DUF2249 domain-containing protein [Pseudomonadota bacterium]
MSSNCSHPAEVGLYPFDARGISKRFRHSAIFGALEALNPGETMRFYNDHNPLPLLAQIEARYGQRVSMCYVAQHAGETIIDFRIDQ